MSFLTNGMPPVTQPALSQNVLDILREMITRGGLAQGDHLKEVELAAALGVSRGPVREAFAHLANEGYIELRRHRGAYVRTLTRADIEEVYSLRLALERLAMTRASTRMTAARLASMDRVLEQMLEVKADYAPEEVVELDLAFHDLVYAAADHERLVRSWQFIRGQVAFFLHARNVTDHDFLEVGYAEHKALREVLAAGSPSAAAQAMTEHMNGAFRRLVAAQEPSANSAAVETIIQLESAEATAVLTALDS
jgi:DNA-binding GntR family transcriptional regulator